MRAGLNMEIAPDLVANQLNVRNGALVLQVHLDVGLDCSVDTDCESL